VRTLVDTDADPGRYEAVWDGRNERGGICAGGVYFCRMEAAEFRAARKLILLK